MKRRLIRHFDEGEAPDSIIGMLELAIQEIRGNPELNGQFEDDAADISVVFSKQGQGILVAIHVGEIKDGASIPIPRLDSMEDLFGEDGDDFDVDFRGGSLN